MAFREVNILQLYLIGVISLSLMILSHSYKKGFDKLTKYSIILALVWQYIVLYPLFGTIHMSVRSQKSI